MLNDLCKREYTRKQIYVFFLVLFLFLWFGFNNIKRNKGRGWGYSFGGTCSWGLWGDRNRFRMLVLTRGHTSLKNEKRKEI